MGGFKLINDSKHYVTIYLTSGKEVFICMTYEALMQLLEQFKDDTTDFVAVQQTEYWTAKHVVNKFVLDKYCIAGISWKENTKE